jgi:hypothetical protein
MDLRLIKRIAISRRGFFQCSLSQIMFEILSSIRRPRIASPQPPSLHFFDRMVDPNLMNLLRFGRLLSPCNSPKQIPPLFSIIRRSKIALGPGFPDPTH